MPKEPLRATRELRETFWIHTCRCECCGNLLDYCIDKSQNTYEAFIRGAVFEPKIKSCEVCHRMTSQILVAYDHEDNTTIEEEYDATEEKQEVNPGWRYFTCAECDHPDYCLPSIDCKSKEPIKCKCGNEVIPWKYVCDENLLKTGIFTQPEQ